MQFSEACTSKTFNIPSYNDKVTAYICFIISFVVAVVTMIFFGPFGIEPITPVAGVLFGVSLLLFGIGYYLVLNGKQTVVIVEEGETRCVAYKEGAFSQAFKTYVSGDDIRVIYQSKEVIEIVRRKGQNYRMRVTYFYVIVRVNREEKLISKNKDASSSKTLAEILAKNLKCDLEFLYEGKNKSFILHYDELDWPFYKRVQKYPLLMEASVGSYAPKGMTIGVSKDGQGRMYKWFISGKNKFFDYLAGFYISAFLAGCSGVFCIICAANLHNNYVLVMFQQSFWPWAVLLVIFSSIYYHLYYRSYYTLEVGNSQITMTFNIAGYYSSTSTMPINQLEECFAYYNTRYYFGRVALLSDKTTINLSFREESTSHYFLSSFQHYIAEKFAERN